MKDIYIRCSARTRSSSTKGKDAKLPSPTPFCASLGDSTPNSHPLFKIIV